MGPFDERADLGLARHVELVDVDLAGEAAGGLGERGEPVFLDVASGDLGAGLGQTLREVRAHALGRAGDDDLEVGQLHENLRRESASRDVRGRYAVATLASSQRASAGYSSRDARLPTTAPT